MIDNVANFAVVTWLRFTRIPWSGSGPVASSTAGNGYNFIVQAADLSRCQDECVRPVGLAFDSRGQLFVSSDTTGEVSCHKIGLKLANGTLHSNRSLSFKMSVHRIAPHCLC